MLWGARLRALRRIFLAKIKGVNIKACRRNNRHAWRRVVARREALAHGIGENM